MTRTPDDYLSEVLRLEQPLRAVLHRFAPQPVDLEDLLQETYARLFSLTPQRREEIRNVQAFAITTARHVAMDWLRRRQVVSIQTIEDFADLPCEDGAELEEIVHTHQQLLRIAAGMVRLPAACREVFVLRRVYGLTQKEIATRLGISEGAVEQHLVRALKRCVELLGTGEPRGRDEPTSRARTLLQRLRKRTSREEQG